MRVAAVALAALFMSPLVQSAVLDAQVIPNPHVRTDSRLLADTIDDGETRSPTFARLVAGLRLSDVIAYVEFDDRLPAGLGGRTRLATAAGGWRYVRVGVCRHLSEYQRIALLAHELHHALEIAGAPEVVDARSLAHLYRTIGVPSICRFECYESARAVDMEREVGRDLDRWARDRRRARKRPSVSNSSRERGAFVAPKE